MAVARYSWSEGVLHGSHLLTLICLHWSQRACWWHSELPGDAGLQEQIEARIGQAIGAAEVLGASGVVHSGGVRDVPVVVARHALLVEGAHAAAPAHSDDLAARSEDGAWESSSCTDIGMEVARLGNALAVPTSGQVIILRVVANIISTGSTVIGLRVAIRGDAARQAVTGLVRAPPHQQVPLRVNVGVHGDLRVVNVYLRSVFICVCVFIC